MTGDPAAIGTDPDAFELHYRAHVREVTYFVARRVLVPCLAAEVFLRAVEAAAGYRGGPGGPRSWLFGIARNIVAEQRRAAARAQRFEAWLAGAPAARRRHRPHRGTHRRRPQRRRPAARRPGRRRTGGARAGRPRRLVGRRDGRDPRHPPGNGPGLYRARWQLRQALTPQLTTEVTP